MGFKGKEEPIEDYQPPEGMEDSKWKPTEMIYRCHCGSKVNRIVDVQSDCKRYICIAQCPKCKTIDTVPSYNCD